MRKFDIPVSVSDFEFDFEAQDTAIKIPYLPDQRGLALRVRNKKQVHLKP